MENLIKAHDDYLNNTGDFGKIGRAFEQIRNQILLGKIDNALHDRVFAVLGASNWVAVRVQYIET